MTADPIAFEDVIRRHQAEVAEALGDLDPMIAEEAISAAVVDLWSEIHAGARTNTDLRADLIARSRRHARALIAATTDHAPVRQETLPSAEDAVLRAMDQIAAKEALERLPEQDRAVIVLVDVEGLTYSEASARLGIAATALPSQLRRARVRLGELWVGLRVAAPAPGEVHLSAEDLIDLAAGRLWKSVRQRMRGHLDHCLSCTARLAEVRQERQRVRHVLPLLLPGMVGATDTVADSSVDRRGWSRHWRTVVRVLLVVVLVLVCLLVFVSRVGTADRGDLGTTSTTPGASAQIRGRELDVSVVWGGAGRPGDMATGDLLSLPYTIAVTGGAIADERVTMLVSAGAGVEVIASPGCTLESEGLRCPGLRLDDDGGLAGVVSLRVLDPDSAALPAVTVHVDD